MDEIYTRIIEGLLGLLVGIGGFMGVNMLARLGKQDDKIADHERALSAFQLRVSQEYAMKTDLNEARRETTDSLKRVYEKIEAVDENMDTKIEALQTDIKTLLRRP